MKPVLDLQDEDGRLVYLTTAKLADYLGYDSPHRINNALKFIARKRLTKYYRSARAVLVRRADVDRVLSA